MDGAGLTFAGVVGGLFLLLAGWWAFSRPDETPRYSAGFGSGFSVGTRRVVGAACMLAGVGAIVSALFV